MKLWQQKFVDKLAGEHIFNDLPPSTARVYAWLMVCQDELQSAPQIQKQLKLSSGAVSSALATLQFYNLVEKQAVPGSRKLLYRLAKNSAQNLLEAQLRAAQTISDLSAQALKHDPSNSQLNLAQKTSKHWLRKLAHLTPKQGK